MKVRFKQSGESPKIGVFTKGDERDIDPKTAQIFIKRGVCVAASDYESKSKKKKPEVINDGG